MKKFNKFNATSAEARMFASEFVGTQRALIGLSNLKQANRVVQLGKVSDFGTIKAYAMYADGSIDAGYDLLGYLATGSSPYAIDHFDSKNEMYLAYTPAQEED